MFCVPVGPGGVGFACLLLRCVREPCSWVSSARRVVCSGAGRAFVLRCLWRSLCAGGLLAGASGVCRLWFCRAGCPPLWRVCWRASVGFARGLGVFVRALPWRLLSVSSAVRSLSLAFGLWRFACSGALRFTGSSVRSGVSLPCLPVLCGRSERAVVAAVCAGRTVLQPLFCCRLAWQPRRHRGPSLSRSIYPIGCLPTRYHAAAGW